MGIQIRGSDDNISASDGSLTIDGVNYSTLQVNGQNLPTAGPLSNRNLVINGAMQVAQRGTSSTSTEYRTVDRFKASTNGGTTTQSQETLSSGDPYDAGFRNFYRITNTTTGTAAAHYKLITHFIEAQNLANSGWNYSSAASNVTLSFWARASVGQDYTFYFRTEDGTGQAYSFNFTLAANTWTKVTHVVPGASAVVFNNDNGKGLQLTWAAWLGSTYIDSGHTNEAWAAINTDSISNVSTTTWGTTTNATFDVTGVQLEVGTVATPFEHRSYGDELARCQRYYVNTNWVFCTSISGLNYRKINPGPGVTMRTSPTHRYTHPSTNVVNKVYEHSSGTTYTINDTSNASSPGPQGSTYFGLSSTPSYDVLARIEYSAEL